MYGQYVLLILLIINSDAKTKDIEGLLTKVESFIDLTTESTLLNIIARKHALQPFTTKAQERIYNEERSREMKSVVNNHIECALSLSLVNTYLILSCKTIRPTQITNSFNNLLDHNQSTSYGHDIVTCDDFTKRKCSVMFGNFTEFNNKEAACLQHSNFTSILCVRNMITTSPVPFEIIVNVSGMFSSDSKRSTISSGSQEISWIQFTEKKNRPVILFSTPTWCNTTYNCQLRFLIQGLFDYEMMLVYRNKTTVLDKDYDQRNRTITQAVGYMPNNFRIEMTIKMILPQESAENVLSVADISFDECTEKNNSVKKNEKVYKECTFDHDVCSWIKEPATNRTCQFSVVDGLQAAVTRKKAIMDHTNQSFLGKFLYVHGRDMCNKRIASFRTHTYQYGIDWRISTCKIKIAVLGTLLLRLQIFFPSSNTNISNITMWNQSQMFAEWTVKEFMVPQLDDKLTFYLQFDTIRSTDMYQDYIAIDDISFSEGCLFKDPLDSPVIKVADSSNLDSLEVIIPVFVSVVFMTMVLGTITVVTKWYGRNSVMRKGKTLHSSPLKWICLESSDSGTTPTVSVTNICHIEDFLTKRNPNYEWFCGRLLNNKLTDIPKEKLTISHKIGNGAFGEVYSGIMLQDYPVKKCRHVAVKTVLQVSSEKARVDFFLEALTLSKFSHPNIVEFLGICVDKNSILLVLEYMAGGDLKNYLRNLRSGQTEDIENSTSRMIDMCLDVAKACKYLEEIKFVHRDIAARNCLLTSTRKDIIVKIADFGLARDILSSDYYRKTGSAMLPVRWMSPESFSEGLFSSKSDVWSFGVLMWEIFSYAQMPYEDHSNTNVITLILTGRRLDKPSLCKQKLYDLMCLCWKTTPTDRPSFAELLSHLETIKQLQNNVIHRTPKIYVRQKKYNTYTSDEFETSPLTSSIQN